MFENEMADFFCICFDIYDKHEFAGLCSFVLFSLHDDSCKCQKMDTDYLHH